MQRVQLAPSAEPFASPSRKQRGPAGKRTRRQPMARARCRPVQLGGVRPRALITAQGRAGLGRLRRRLHPQTVRKKAALLRPAAAGVSAAARLQVCQLAQRDALCVPVGRVEAVREHEPDKSQARGFDVLELQVRRLSAHVRAPWCISAVAGRAAARAPHRGSAAGKRRRDPRPEHASPGRRSGDACSGLGCCPISFAAGACCLATAVNCPIMQVPHPSAARARAETPPCAQVRNVAPLPPRAAEATAGDDLEGVDQGRGSSWRNTLVRCAAPALRHGSRAVLGSRRMALCAMHRPAGEGATRGMCACWAPQVLRLREPGRQRCDRHDQRQICQGAEAVAPAARAGAHALSAPVGQRAGVLVCRCDEGSVAQAWFCVVFSL